ncbi:MAG: alpha/beta hydrolase [Proteobacteria bacterium]|nr:alpha/beta hydrolase [Pseudomonadota bacterium]
MTFFKSLMLSLSLAGLTAFPVAAGEVLNIKPRDGVFLRMLIDEVPDGAKDVVVLFPGGHGRVLVKKDGTFKGTKSNFLTRTRKLFAANGLVTILFDAPSDHRKGEGMTFAYRMTEEHTGDIKLAIAKVRERFPGLSVWLMGTSRGSTSAANAAANIKDGAPDGVVLTSTIGQATKFGGNVLDFNLAAVTIPVLVFHHNDDGCMTTPITGAKNIKDALINSKGAEIIIVEGGSSGSGGSGEGRTCGSQSHHGFLDIEQKVVDAISAWIKSH